MPSLCEKPERLPGANRNSVFVHAGRQSHGLANSRPTIWFERSSALGGAIAGHADSIASVSWMGGFGIESEQQRPGELGKVSSMTSGTFATCAGIQSDGFFHSFEPRGYCATRCMT